MKAGQDVRISSKDFTKFELARVIGSRALQISHGAPLMVKLTTPQLEAIHYNPIEIAKIELEKGVIPITVVRPLPNK
jgi:DNA-directed RNA polymerase subunit K